MLLMTLAHLIRIDKLIPIIGETLGNTGAMWFICLVIIAEVFALPYLLQMKLSPLLRVKSGLMVILVPLAWTCFTIWAHGNGHSTGQFSSYLSSPSSWWLIVLNLAWLAASYWTLRVLSFDKAFAALRKKR